MRRKNKGNNADKSGTDQDLPNVYDGAPDDREGDFSIRVLIESNGSCPFDESVERIRENSAKARLLLRLTRIERTGNIGDHRERISGAVSELRIDYGPGYRVYYTLAHRTIVVLLCCGIKASQKEDIDKAVHLWERNQNDVERFSREFRG